jgi:hypothetical protein
MKTILTTFAATALLSLTACGGSEDAAVANNSSEDLVVPADDLGTTDTGLGDNSLGDGDLNAVGAEGNTLAGNSAAANLADINSAETNTLGNSQ